MKREKGITLVALVITIIVMLILVGVTLKVVLDGGLIEKADKAKSAQEAAIKAEELQSMVLGCIGDNGSLKLADVQESLASKVNSISGDTESLNVTYGGYNFTIAKNGKVKEQEQGSTITASDIAGTYYMAGDTTSETYFTLKANMDVEPSYDASGMENTVWTYDASTNKVKFSKTDDGELPITELEFKQIKEGGNVVNKALILVPDQNDSGNPGTFLATSLSGLYPFEGTYISEELKAEFNKASHLIMTYEKQDNGEWIESSGNGTYAIIDNYIYISEGLMTFEQQNNYQTITINGITLTKQ